MVKEGKSYWRNWKNLGSSGMHKGGEDGWAERKMVKKK